MRRGLRLPSLAGLHLVVAVPAVVLLVALVPPLQSPDETIHVCRAGQPSRGTPMSIVDAQGRVGNDVDVGLRWLARNSSTS